MLLQLVVYLGFAIGAGTGVTFFLLSKHQNIYEMALSFTDLCQVLDTTKHIDKEKVSWN